MKTFLTIFISCFVFCSSLNAQSVSGNLTLLANQEIELEGFSGLKTYPISSTKVDEAGGLKLPYSKVDYGVAVSYTHLTLPTKA